MLASTCLYSLYAWFSVIVQAILMRDVLYPTLQLKITDTAAPRDDKVQVIMQCNANFIFNVPSARSESCHNSWRAETWTLFHSWCRSWVKVN